MEKVVAGLHESDGVHQPPFPNKCLNATMQAFLKKRLLKLHKSGMAVQVSVVDSQIFGCVGMHAKEVSTDCFVPSSMQSKYELPKEDNKDSKPLWKIVIPKGVDVDDFEEAL